MMIRLYEHHHHHRVTGPMGQAAEAVEEAEVMEDLQVAAAMDHHLPQILLAFLLRQMPIHRLC